MRDQSGGPVALGAIGLIGLLLSGCASWGAPEMAFDTAGAGDQQVARQDDTGMTDKIAGFFAPLTGTDVTAPVPTGYANETTQPFRAGSRFSPDWPAASLARAPKPRLAKGRVVRLPWVDPIGLFAQQTKSPSSTGDSTTSPGDDRVQRLPTVVQ